MRELDPEKLIIYAVSIVLLAVTTPFVRKIPRNGGRNPIAHVAFLAVAICLLLFLPDFIQDEMFSPGSVMVVGTIIPVY